MVTLMFPLKLESGLLSESLLNFVPMFMVYLVPKVAERKPSYRRPSMITRGANQ